MKEYDVEEAAVSEAICHFPHWGWLLFSLILFWPAAFIWLVIGSFRKKYKVHLILKGGNQVITYVDKTNYEKIVGEK